MSDYGMSDRRAEAAEAKARRYFFAACCSLVAMFLSACVSWYDIRGLPVTILMGVTSLLQVGLHFRFKQRAEFMRLEGKVTQLELALAGSRNRESGVE